jgi:hypothetical protein
MALLIHGRQHSHDSCPYFLPDRLTINSTSPSHLSFKYTSSVNIIVLFPSSASQLFYIKSFSSPKTLTFHPLKMSTKPATCCGKSSECVCATQAKCSCGSQSALQCTCDKAATENTVSGPRCSCRKRFTSFSESLLNQKILEEANLCDPGILTVVYRSPSSRRMYL